MTEEIDFTSRFEEFLSNFKTVEGETPYRAAIERLVLSKQIFILIDFNHLLTYDPTLATATRTNPQEAIDAASEAIHRILRVVDPDHAASVERLHARFKDVPDRVSVRTIRAEHIGRLMMVDALVTRVSDVKPLLVEGFFRCRQCGEEVRLAQPGQYTVPQNCQCRGKSAFELVPERSKFVDWQKIRLQEKPEELPPGTLPRALDCILLEDLVDSAQPGDPCRVVGILRSTQDYLALVRRRASTFSVSLATNYVDVSERESDRVEITPKEEEEIRKLAEDPLIHRKIVNSIAPSIYGLTDVKEAVALLLFGGVSKTLADGMKIRGDSNILIVGDPGTAKSQLLRYVAAIAPRGLYTSGKGSTAAGLTAAVMRDPDTQGFTLEAGALVLADRGTACIDEFDKMNPQDRTAIHEAMEQHSYHPDTEILATNGTRIKMGSFVDRLMLERRDEVIQGIDCEILPFDELEAYTTDFKNIVKARVDRVSRHSAPDRFFKLTFTNGRSVTVTPEHPVFVFRDATMSCIPASECKANDFVPVPRYLPNSCSPVMLTSSLKPVDARSKAIDFPSVLTPVLARMLGYFVSEGHSCEGSTVEVGFSNMDASLLEEVEKGIFSVFGIVPIPSHRSDGLITLRYLSVRLCDWLSLNFPEMMVKSRFRRIPDKILNASAGIAREFLAGAFMGDGSIERTAVCFRTASAGLSRDYQDLLLKLGIQTRIVHDSHNDSFKVYIRGQSLVRFFNDIVEESDPRYGRIRDLIRPEQKKTHHHDVFPTSIIREIIAMKKDLGIAYSGHFHRHLKSNHGITRNILERELAILSSKYDYTKNCPGNCLDITDLRKRLGYSQAVLASIAGLTRGTIDYHERGGYDQKTRQEIRVRILAALDDKLEEIRERLAKLYQLKDADVLWDRIKNIEVIENAEPHFTPYVYDITVKPNHTFVGQGVILHNTVSIAKAGIVATLNARTAILAAANPTLGRYVPERSFADNVNLPVTLLSRFDLIFTLTDQPEAERDEQMAEHIISLHRKKGTSKEPPISPDFLRKYIAYARRSMTPRVTDEALKVVKEFYLGMRKAGELENAPVPITARQLESLIRLAEAHAKMALRATAIADDAQAAIRLVQVSLQQVGIDRETGQYDIDNIMIGRGKSQRDKLQTLLTMLRDLEKEIGGPVPIDKLEKRAELDGMSAEFVKQAVQQLRDKDGVIFEPRPGYLKYIRGA